jgi:Flp pilus assembly protein TadG
MLTIVLGVFDVGNAIQQSIELRQAVRAGAQYALSFPDASDIPSKITAAITGMTANTPTVSAVACSCVDITTGAPTADASCAPCLAGSILTRSITLDVSASYSALLLPISTLSASYVVRYQ